MFNKPRTKTYIYIQNTTRNDSYFEVESYKTIILQLSYNIYRYGQPKTRILIQYADNIMPTYTIYIY